MPEAQERPYHDTARGRAFGRGNGRASDGGRRGSRVQRTSVAIFVMCDVECASLSSSGGFRKEKVRAGGSRGKVAGRWRFVLVFLRSGEVGSRFKCWSQRDFRGRSNRSPPLLGLTKRSLGGPVFFRGQRSNETACRVFTRDLRYHLISHGIGSPTLTETSTSNPRPRPPDPTIWITSRRLLTAATASAFTLETDLLDLL